MFAGRQMTDKKDVAPPGECIWIQSTSDEESQVWALFCRLDEQFLQGCLPVLGISPEIGKIGAVGIARLGRAVMFRIDVTVEWSDRTGAEIFAQCVESAAAG